jgi:hypothetical protein
MPQIKDRTNAAPKASTELEARVASLENELASIKASVGFLMRASNKKMLDTFGSMPDNEASREAERLGREYRNRQPKC